jgi:cytochrome c oxidase subunit 4
MKTDMKAYLFTTLALLVLLALTVAVARVNLGVLNTPAAILISTVKAVLIGLFFMHLPRQHPISRIFAGAGFFWLGLLIILALSDYLTR